MAKILTLTLNPALDLTVRLAQTALGLGSAADVRALVEKQ